MSDALGAASAGRRISRVSAVEVQDSQFSLENLYKKYCQGEDGINEQQFVFLISGSDLIDKSCSETDCGLIFASVRVGKKTTLNFDRFTEAIRKIAVKKEMTYQELVQQASANMESKSAAVTPASIPAGVDPSAVFSPVQIPDGTNARKDSKVRLDAFVDAVPNRSPSRGSKLNLFEDAVPGTPPVEVQKVDSSGDEAAAMLAAMSADLDAKDAAGAVEQLETAASSDEVQTSVLGPVSEAVAASNELFAAGKMEEALAKLTGAADLLKNATDPPAAVVATVYSNQGAVLQKLGRFDEAEAALVVALGKNANSSNLHNTYGAVLHSQDKKEQALASFTKALELQPGFLLPIKGCMDCYASLGQFQQAADFAEQVLAQEPTNGDALRSKGYALIKLESFADALVVLKKCKAQGDNSNEVSNWMQISFTQLAVKAEEGGKTDEALGYYKEALALEKGEPSTQLVLSHALLLSKTDKLPEAVTSLRALLAKEPAGGTGEGGFADAQAVLGELLVRQMDFEGAVVPLAALCAPGAEARLEGVRVSKKLDLLYSYAMTLAQVKKLDEADAAFTRVLELDPEHADAKKAVAMLKGAADGTMAELTTGGGTMSAQVDGSISEVLQEQKAKVAADQEARATVGAPPTIHPPFAVCCFMPSTPLCPATHIVLYCRLTFFCLFFFGLQEEAAAAAATVAKAEADRAAANSEQAGTFPYDQLQNEPFPAGVDKGKREIYLSDSVFEEVLGMSKAKFAALPGWKASGLKKKANLF
jgi:tetratricopeptide (TPR) repeat protein